MDINQLLLVGIFGVSSVFAQEIYELKDGRKYQLIEKMDQNGWINKIYEEIYDGDQDFNAKVTLKNGKTINVEDISLESFKSRDAPSGTDYFRSKSITIKVDEANYLIKFKDMDKFAFPESLKYVNQWYQGPIVIYLKNGKEVEGDYRRGYTPYVRGKVYNKVLEQYSIFEKPLQEIIKIDFDN